MSIPIPVALKNKLQSFQQQKLLSGWEHLTDVEVTNFIHQLDAIDFEQLLYLFHSHQSTPSINKERPAAEISPPESLIRLPVTSDEKKQWRAAANCG